MSEQPIFQAFDPHAELEITARDLPHWFQPGVAIFVTSRTFDSMPPSVTDLWQSEPFDHLVRSDEQFEYLRRYIRDNPARAGLKPGEFLYRTKSGPPGPGGSAVLF